MHVMYIVGEFPSATEHFILNEIDALRKESYRVTIVSLSSSHRQRVAATEMTTNTPDLFYDRKITRNKLLVSGSFLLHEPSRFAALFKKALFFGQKSWLRTTKDMLSALYIYRNLGGLKIRRVHAHFAGRPADIGYILSCLFDLPLSISAHANDIYVHPEKIKRKVALSEFMVTCTQYNLRFLSSLCGPALAGRLYLIHHGLDLRKWPCNVPHPVQAPPPILTSSPALTPSRTPSLPPPPAEPDNCLSVLTIGRLIEKKGIADLIQASLLLHKNKIHVRLTIIGEGPLRTKLKTFCEQNGLDKCVIFLDFIPQQDLLPYYHQSDIFVLPCKIAGNGDRDGIPNVLLEAMAAGIPVISTSVSAIPEVIIEGTTGLLVREGDPGQLAAAMERLYIDRQFREKLKWHARTFIGENMTIHEATGKLIALFEKEHRINLTDAKEKDPALS